MSAVAEPIAAAIHLPASVPTPPPSLTPADFVRGLPAEFRLAVLGELVREISAEMGRKGVVPLRSYAGEWLGNLVLPEEPAAVADREYFELDPMHRMAAMKPYLDLDFENAYTHEQILALMAGAGPKSASPELSPPAHHG